MTDTEKIAALAAELQRLGTMPEWIKSVNGGGLRYHYIHEGPESQVGLNQAVLAALSGVAAEVCAKHRIIIWDSVDSSGWRVEDGDGNELADDDEPGFATYHEALVAALKQVEVNP